MTGTWHQEKLVFLSEREQNPISLYPLYRK